MVLRPTLTPTCAHTVLTECVSAVVSVMDPNCSSEKFFSGTPETMIGDVPDTVESGV